VLLSIVPTGYGKTLNARKPAQDGVSEAKPINRDEDNAMGFGYYLYPSYILPLGVVDLF
jgi:hypothetical protein